MTLPHPSFMGEDGKLVQYADPGGYLIEWVDMDGYSLCAECATIAHKEQQDIEPTIHEAGSKGFTCESCEEHKT